MAIIKCPKCDKDISDKALKCVHCGQVLSEEKKVFCEECGNEIKNNDKVCRECGCPIKEENISDKPQPVEVTKVNLGSNFSKKGVIIGIITLLLIICIVPSVIFINRQSENRKAKRISEEYKNNLSTITYKMLNGAADAESCGNLIKSVWNNTIWEKSSPETDKYTKTNGSFNDDFNDSLSTLFQDSDFIKKIDAIEQNTKEVNDLLKKMKNPPKEWEEAYSDLKDYYDDYLTLTNLGTNPSGNLQTYSSNFNNADSAALNSYNKMKTYLDW